MTENTSEERIPLPSDLQQSTINDSVPVEGNPLSQYFRHPKLHIELPTGGNFWPEGVLKLKEDNTLDIFPMTARDEIIMKSPEGLLSGTSVVEMVSSCVPGIKDPWLMPAHDIDTILIAIRLASYDHELEFNSTCPHCKHSNHDEIDLRQLLDSIPKGKIKNVFKVDELTFEFKPYTFRFVNENNKARFEQEKLARTMADAELTDEEKKEYFNGMFKKLAIHNTKSLVAAIHKINMPSGTSVSDKNQIKEFIDNTSRDMITKIREKLTEMSQSAAMPDIKLACSNCDREYTTTIEFNQSNFFE